MTGDSDADSRFQAAETTGVGRFANQAPGTVSIEEFIEAIEAVNSIRTDTDDWSFDSAQEAVITYDDGPLHVTAGPGAGKTEVGIARVLRWLIVDGVPPESIVLTTFTEKAAAQLKQRLEDRLTALGFGDEINAYDIWIDTLHSLCGDIMREFRYDEYVNIELLDPNAQQMFIQQHSDFVEYLANGGAGAFPSVAPYTYENGGCARTTAADIAATLFNRLAQYNVDIEALADADNEALQRLAEGYRGYQETLREQYKCDFAQLQLRFQDFLESPAGQRFLEGDTDRDISPLRRLLVDEYQDVNPLQQEIYFKLAEHCEDHQVTVVGDDDQSLYRFRGATVDCFIEFPDRLASELDLADNTVQTLQLKHNYRSHPDIVDWCNQHINDHPVMAKPGARAPGKEPMNAGRDGDDSPRVKFLPGRNLEDTGEGIAETIEQMHTDGYISDYNQVAILAHSTREEWEQYDSTTLVGECVSALEDRGIDVYNPRNKGLLEHEEVKLLLGALRACLDPDGQWAAAEVGSNTRVHELLAEWDATLDRWLTQNQAAELENAIEDVTSQIQDADPGDRLQLSVLKIVHRLRGARPFSDWTQGPESDPERAKRLGKLTELISSFESIADGLTRDRQLKRTTQDEYATVSTRFLSDFYWMLCGYLDEVDLDDPEDSQEQFPSAHVQVMTVHQAKGLEFPVVFVTSLNQTPKTSDDSETFADRVAPFTSRTPPATSSERDHRDLIRQFYVAHSRAEEQLILAGSRQQTNGPPENPLPAFGYDGSQPVGPADFMGERSISRPSTAVSGAPPVESEHTNELDQEYSIVGDVLAYRRCKRQYGFLTEYGFESAQAVQLFAGQAVHQTLDWAHRHYNGDVDGVAGGEPPSSEELRSYFDDVVDALRQKRITPFSPEAIGRVFDHLDRFNETVGPELYPKVQDTECQLRYVGDNHILTGQADLVARENTGIEIVDYKASQRPEPGDKLLEDYTEQLRVYGGLYYLQEGVIPETAAIYFLNEEDQKRMRFEVELDEDILDSALAEFEATANAIKHTRETDSWGDITPSEAPPESTCDVCDFRHDCPAYDPD